MNRHSEKYRIDIDGLRAVAILPVIFYHAGFSVFSGGFIGVDVFFVISGYLITSIVWREIIEENFSLVDFYERRARRILPAVLFVVLLCLPLAYLTLLPSDFKDFGWSLVGVATFSSNIIFWQQSDYFATAAELTPLLHTWSLAVEEQFYLIFPILLLFAYKIRRQAALMAILSLAILSFALSYWGTFNMPVATFYLLPTRAWELLIGSIAAFYPHKSKLSGSPTASNIISIFGLGMIIFAMFGFDKSTPFPGIAALAPTLGAFGIILFSKPGTLVYSLLSQKFLIGIGLISYSLYLWHQPVFALYKNYSFEISVSEYLICIAITFGLAIFSYFYIEIPIRQKRELFTRRKIFSGAAFALLTLVLLGIFAPRALPVAFQGTPATEIARNYEPDRRILADASWSIIQGKHQHPRIDVTGDPSEQQLSFDDNDDRYAMLLVGNSHSKDLFNVLSFSKMASDYFQIARFGTQLFQISDAFFGSANYRRADVIVLVSRYTTADMEAFDTLATRMTKDGKIVVMVPNIYEFFDSGRYTLADRMVLEFFKHKRNDYAGLTKEVGYAFLRDYHSGIETSMYKLSMQKIRGIVNRLSNAVILDRMDYVCDTQQCYALNDQLEKYFFDYGHHTLAGARFFGTRVDLIGWLDPLIEKLHSRN